MMAGSGWDASRDARGQAAEGNDVLPISALVGILWKWLWVIALVAFVTAGAAVGFSITQDPVYQPSIKILVGQDRGIVTDTPQDAIALESLTETMATAVTSHRTAEAVVRELDLQMGPDQVLANLTAEAIPETQFVEVFYSDTNPERAARVVNAVGTVFSEQISEVSPDANPVTATVWERAQVPDAPVSPNPLRNGLLALVLGGMLGMGLAFLLEFLDDRWQSPEEAEQITGVPTLGLIPQFQAFKYDEKKRKQEESE